MVREWKKKTRKTLKVGSFLVLNSILPGVDVTTDVATANQLFEKGHPVFGAWSICCVFAPFFCKMVFNLNRAWRGESKRKMALQTFFHVPLVTPFINLQLSINHALTDTEDSRNAKMIEDAMTFACHGSFHESFLESGFQLLIQILIILTTGSTTSVLQLVSMAFSLLSLTLAGSKGFYSQRPQEESDPEPGFYMILVVFFPMLSMVINSVLSWTIIVAILNEGVILCYILIFFSIFSVLKLSKTCSKSNASFGTKKESENLSMKSGEANYIETRKHVPIISIDHQKSIIAKLRSFNYKQSSRRPSVVSTTVHTYQRQHGVSREPTACSRILKAFVRDIGKLSQTITMSTHKFLSYVAEEEGSLQMFDFRSSYTGYLFF